METKITSNRTQEIKEHAADVITGQPVVVMCGDKEYQLKPRTPHQLRAISKRIAKYSAEMTKALLGIGDGKDSKKKADAVNNEAMDYLVIMVQMLLDTNAVFDNSKPTITQTEIENEMDFSQISKVIAAAAYMHDVTDLIGKTQRLRII